MIVELRAGFILFVSLAFLLAIVAVFALSTVMKPNRWSDRARLASKARSSGQAGLSTAA